MTTTLNTNLIKIQEELIRMNSNSTLDQILTTILETIMKIERQEFLKDLEWNKWNWYYSRFLKLLSWKISINIPRDREWEFRPLILEIMKNNQDKYLNLVKELYFKWLTHWDIQSLMNKIYWSSISSSTITNLTNELLDEFNEWKHRKLSDEYALIQLDTMYCKVKRWAIFQSEWFTIVLWMWYNWTREILWIYSTPNESIYNWKEILEDIKERWIRKPLVIVADWIKYLEQVIQEVYPKALFQKCVVHKMRNILNKVRAFDKEEVSKDLKTVFNLYLETDNIDSVKNRLHIFIDKRKKQYPFIKNSFDEWIIDYYFTYLNFPFIIRNMIYTTNWLERFNRWVKKKIKIRNWLPSESAVMKLIFSTVLEFQDWVYSYTIGSVVRVKEDLYNLLDKLYN